MKHISKLAAAFALVAASSAQSAVITYDFVTLTETVLGESAWNPLRFDDSGHRMDVYGDDSTTSRIGDAWAYLDWNNAGLGVCNDLTSSGTGNTARPGSGGNICAPSSDDNTTLDEQLVFMFNANVTIEKIWLNNTHDADREIKNPETVSVNGVSTLVPGNGYVPIGDPDTSDNSRSDSSADNWIGGYDVAYGNTFILGYGGDMPEQFYVSGMQVRFDEPTGNEPPPPQIPLPGTLLLLGAGLLGLGAARRRRAH